MGRNIYRSREDAFFKALNEKQITLKESTVILVDLLNQGFDFEQTLLMKLFVRLSIETGEIYYEDGKYLINPDYDHNVSLFKNGTEEGMKTLERIGFKIHKEDPRKKRQPRCKQRKEPIDFDKK